MPALRSTEELGLSPDYAGKVRDVFDLGDALLIVATDRLSAFDVVSPTPIPDKGRVLTALSVFWFGLLADLTRIGLANLLRLELAFPDDGRGPTVIVTSTALF